jgi:hypothetical protein
METQILEKILNELVRMNKNLGLIKKQMRLPDEQWLDTTDVCQRLRISDRTLAGHRKSKQIKYYTRGKKLYYHVTDVDNYPAGGEQKQHKS